MPTAGNQPAHPATPAAYSAALAPADRAQAMQDRIDAATAPAPAPVAVHAPPAPTPTQTARVTRDHTRPTPPAPRPRRPGRVGGWAPAATGTAAVVVGFALAQVGRPYVFGAAGPRGFDCSGLALAAYARAGIRLPHDANALARYGRPIARAQLAPGDLVLYRGHVGIYIGGGMMVAAANPREGVVRQAIYGTPGGYRRLL